MAFHSFNVLCDCCYRLFPFSRIRVRCTSNRCAAVRDTAGRRSPRRMLPDGEGLWAKKGRLLDLARPCPYCAQTETLIPACPSCWHPLDPEIGQVEDRMIAVLGARQAGKSHFLAALLHQLLRRQAGGEVWTVSIRDEPRLVVENHFLRPLFRDLEELPATPVGSPVALRLVLTHQDDGRRILLRFEDRAGETISDRKRLAAADFLRYAAGVVLLADPLAFEPPARGARRDWHHHEPTYLEILEGYRQVLRAAPRRQEDVALPLLPEQKYLAVVVTKADLVLHRNHAFWRPAENGAHLAPGYWHARRAESDTAATWLRRQLADPHDLAAATDLFADVSCFFASSYGYAHKPHATLRKPPQPLRVHEPLFALLDRFATGAVEAGRPAVAAGQRRRVVADDDVL